jgi:hypothetical protein
LRKGNPSPSTKLVLEGGLDAWKAIQTTHIEKIQSLKIYPFNNTSPQAEESYGYHPEIPYVVSHEEINTFRRITRAYARQIGALPTTPLLPRRRRTVRPIVSTYEHTLVHMVEDLVYFSLLEIEQPFWLNPKYTYSYSSCK